MRIKRKNLITAFRISAVVAGISGLVVLIALMHCFEGYNYIDQQAIWMIVVGSPVSIIAMGFCTLLNEIYIQSARKHGKKIEELW